MHYEASRIHAMKKKADRKEPEEEQTKQMMLKSDNKRIIHTFLKLGKGSIHSHLP